jgi:hypothetical protein
MKSLLSVFRDLDTAMMTCSRAQAPRRLRGHIPNFAQHGRWHEQRPAGMPQQAQARPVSVVLTLPAARTTPVSHSSMLRAEFGAENLLRLLGQVRPSFKEAKNRAVTQPSDC